MPFVATHPDDALVLNIPRPIHKCEGEGDAKYIDLIDNKFVGVVENFFDLYFQGAFAADQPSNPQRSHFLGHPPTPHWCNSSGTKCHFLYPGRRSTSEPSWEEVEVVGLEIDQRYGEHNYACGIVQLYRFARKVFRRQGRYFVYGIYIHAGRMEIWMFYRSGMFRSASFDMADYPRKGPAIFDHFTRMSDAELGMVSEVHASNYLALLLTMDFHLVRGRSMIHPPPRDSSTRKDDGSTTLPGESTRASQRGTKTQGFLTRCGREM